MKELHNHIFSNTTCISKENMLKYINKQLPKNELYDVEKHMLDCDFCTEAFEGLKFAQNSSILFAIDNQIDLKSSNKTPLYRHLMLAASVIAIIIGSFFTFNFFNKTIDNTNNLAIQEIIEKEEPILKKEENLQSISTEEKSIEPIEVTDEEVTLIDENEQLKAFESDNYISNNSNQKISIVDEEVVIESEATEQIQPAVSLAEVDYFEEDEVEENEAFIQQDQATQTINNEINETRSVNRKAKKNTSITSKDAAPAINATKYKNTKYVNDLKVLDYSEEYEFDYELKKSVEGNSLSPDFATKEDKVVSKKELEKSIVEITYNDVLEAATKSYTNKEYTNAIAKFNTILKTHPNDVNAHFYTAMSFYQLKDYNKALTFYSSTLNNNDNTFKEDAQWYKALSFIELGSISDAKVLLDQIINESGIYKAQANEKIKKLD